MISLAISLAISFLISLATPTLSPPPAAGEIEARVTADKDELFKVTVHADHEPVLAVLKAICSKASRPMTVATQAMSEARSAVVSVDLEGRPFDQALEWIGGAAGLDVRLTDEGVAVAKINDEDPDRESVATHAIELYRRALVRYADHPEVPRLYLEIGKLEAMQQRWPLALLEFETILRSFPGSPLMPDALFHSGRAYLNASDITTGRQRLLSLAERRPDSPLAAEALLLVAGTYQGIDAEHMLRLIRQALDSLGEVTTRVKIQAIEMLLELGEFAPAMQVCEETLTQPATEAEKQELLLVKLRIHKEMGDSREAARAARTFLSTYQGGTSAVSASIIMSELALEAERPFEALTAATHAEQMDKGQANRFALERLFALSYREMQLPGRALPHFEKALSFAPDHQARQEMASLAARMAFDDDQFEVARKFYDLWRQSGGPTGKSLLGVASCFAKEGKSERALETAETALAQCEDEPTKTALLTLLGEVHERTGAFDAAARAFSGGGEHELDANDSRAKSSSR